MIEKVCLARGLSILASVLLATGLPADDTQAQFGGPPPPPPGPAREVAPWDPTGQWVASITEDWRFRMVTPPKNDYPGLPLTNAARAAADAWDPQRDIAEGAQCKAYGAAGIMRIPTRLRIDWEDESTLRIQTDAGRQRRTLHFDGATPGGRGRTLQGSTLAEWELHGGGFRGPPVTNGTIRAVTTNMTAGYYRKNGVPYSENAVLTEYFDLQEMHDGTQWLVVLSVLDDPENFFTPVITSTNFRREDSRRGWDPQECRVD
ncbi:MAG: hypothetical protein PVF50_01910 [Gammaproteobacteria bacterium]